jgi:hypothetical protein
MTAAVPTARLVSNSHTFLTSAVGTTEQRMASSVMAQPEMGLTRLPAFQALAKM